MAGGYVVASPEFSHRKNGLKRIDFIIAGKSWEIQLLRDWNSVTEHYEMFLGNGSYVRFHLSDFILLDFRTSMTRPSGKL
jgi:hypothetical protein